jgi:hypothetical protein
MTVLPLFLESWHHGVSLAEIERQLRADQYSDDQIDLAIAFVVTVREELAKRGKWPPPSVEQRPS